MKNLILIILMATIASCSSNSTYNFDKYPQKWTLVKMSGRLPDSEKTGADMWFQEYYLLKSGGEFTKHREVDGVIHEESGVFTFIDKEDQKFIVLTYNDRNEIIASCYSDTVEELSIQSKIKLIGTWSHCDGPGLEYERIK